MTNALNVSDFLKNVQSPRNRPVKSLPKPNLPLRPQKMIPKSFLIQGCTLFASLWPMVGRGKATFSFNLCFHGFIFRIRCLRPKTGIPYKIFSGCNGGHIVFPQIRHPRIIPCFYLPRFESVVDFIPVIDFRFAGIWEIMLKPPIRPRPFP